jgi:DNA ligase D
MFGPNGPTKLDLVLYYARVADWILPEIIGRPLYLPRCPSANEDECFLEHTAFAGLPEAVRQVPIPEGETFAAARYLVVDDGRGLLTLAQFGVVEFHPWGSTLARPDRPDRLIFDLDPSEEVPWRNTVAAAFHLRDELVQLGLAPFVKTTGGKGLHVVVPIEPGPSWAELGEFAEAFAGHMCQLAPDRYTRSSGRRLRAKRIYIDHLRNRRGATAVAAYSLRARSGLPVALPIGWDELATLSERITFTYDIVQEKVGSRPFDPWVSIDRFARPVTQAMANAVGLKRWGDAR